MPVTTCRANHPCSRLNIFRATLLLLLSVVIGTTAASADPAVQHMERVARDLVAAQKTQSQGAWLNALTRHGDIGGIGLYSLGDYRPKLEANDKPSYLSGMTRFIARYATTEAPKYPVATIKFAQESRRAKYGLTVDSTVTLQDGSNYEVAWLLIGGPGSYRVRDVQAAGFWISPFLKKLFEDYIAQNNGNVKALVMVLNR
jgi:phospholipid transport system substrate-binding protein